MAFNFSDIVAEVWDTSKQFGELYVASDLAKEQAKYDADARNQTDDSMSSLATNRDVNVFGTKMNKTVLYATGGGLVLLALLWSLK